MQEEHVLGASGLNTLSQTNILFNELEENIKSLVKMLVDGIHFVRVVNNDGGQDSDTEQSGSLGKLYPFKQNKFFQNLLMSIPK